MKRRGQLADPANVFFRRPVTAILEPQLFLPERFFPASARNLFQFYVENFQDPLMQNQCELSIIVCFVCLLKFEIVECHRDDMDANCWQTPVVQGTGFC